MKSFTSRLRSEISRLEMEISKDTKQKRLAQLKETLLHYETLVSPPLVPGGEKTKEERVKEEALALLRGGPIHRKALLRELARKQVLRGTEGDMNYLSTRLSMWDEASSDKKGNWCLATWDH